MPPSPRGTPGEAAVTAFPLIISAKVSCARPADIYGVLGWQMEDARVLTGPVRALRCERAHHVTLPSSNEL